MRNGARNEPVKVRFFHRTFVPTFLVGLFDFFRHSSAGQTTVPETPMAIIKQTLPRRAPGLLRLTPSILAETQGDRIYDICHVWSDSRFQWNRSPHSWSSDGSALGSRAHNDQPGLSPGGHHFAETGAQVLHFQSLREQNPVHRSRRWNGYWAGLKDHAPSGAPALALYPPAASRRPNRTQLCTPNRRASGPRLHRPCTRPSRGPPRGLPIVRLIPKQLPTCCR